jgi:thiol:disulfide interchange protein
MTPRFSAGQHKMRLITVFLFTVALALAFQVLHSRPADMTANAANTLDDSLFIGVRHAGAKEIQGVLPDIQGKPAVLDFTSRLCHDCQRMNPVMDQLMPKHPAVRFHRFIVEDRDQYPAVFRVFKPVSVPMLIFVDNHGEIRNVLYNYQAPATVAAALGNLERQSLPAKAAVKSSVSKKPR